MNWNFDNDGYPADDTFVQLENMQQNFSIDEWKEFLINDLLELRSHCPYITTTYCEHPESGEWEVSFHTGGWSGAESIINFLLEVDLLHYVFYYSWRRGGHYSFRGAL